jgi:hypothetical protein
MEETIRPERAPSSYAPASLATTCNRAKSVESNSGERGPLSRASACVPILR